ncbi:MAG: hypothetical protein IJ735_02605 [Clostridia bacterium]|nr:hypothetical protein [Clostridia bacterium]
MTKKLRLIFAALTALTILLAALIGLAPAQAAQADGLTWEVRVTKYVNATYVDVGTESTLTDASSITILIKNNGSAGDNFSYYSSAEKIDTDDLKNRTNGWSDISSSSTMVVDGDTYLFANEAFGGKTQRYFYFRRQYSVEENGVVSYKNEYYSRYWHVVVNADLQESDLAIERIDARYRRTGGDYEEYGGEWIGVDLTFTVTTKYMIERNGGAFDPGSEKLRYSIDGKNTDDRTKVWIPMSKNTVSIKNSLKNGKVDFELTDIDRNFFKYSTYSKRVNIDAEEPIFTVSATTRDAGGEEKTYSNGEWSCADILFTLTDRSACISDVEYSVSTDGANFARMETANYRVSTTTRGLKFRATNRAGVMYTVDASYSALIDVVRPGVAVRGFTPDPDEETTQKAIVDGYANGSVTLNVFNRDVAGDTVTNTSDVRCYYRVKVNDGEYSSDMEATNYTYDGEKYFILTGAIGKNVVLEKREYVFYLVSGAGLKSNETSYTVTLVNSVFDIEVEEITYVTNASGWSATPIDVRVTVPTDSRIVRDYEGNIVEYSVPTAKYTFVYAPVNISGVSYKAEGSYYSNVEGEEGKSVYTFKLDASAESVFTVYALNAAGKRSASTFTSANVIKIDTQQPTVEITGYVKNGDVSGDDSVDPIYISSGTWVNGRVNLTLTVKDGVSGVSVRDMHYAVDGAGNPVYDAYGNMVWQESSTTRPWNGQLNQPDGSRYFVYNVVVGVPNSTVTKMSEEYRFRVYTGSGVYKDVSFLVNIDLNTIILERVEYSFGEIEGDVSVSDSDITTASVCADGKVTLFSNEAQRGHFDYYLYDETAENYVLVESNEISFEVPVGRRGTL